MARFDRYDRRKRPLFSEANENEKNAFLESLRNVTGPNAIIDDQGIHFRRQPFGGKEVQRFIVTTAAAEPYPLLVLAKKTDDAGPYGPAIPVKWATELAVDDEFLAVQPRGGVTDGPLTHAGANVEWEELGGGGDNRGVAYKIISNASGGGKYNLSIGSDGSIAAATGNLSLAGADAPTLDISALGLNPNENGAATHNLPVDSYGIGVIVGDTEEDPPRPIVMMGQSAVSIGSTIYDVYSMVTGTTAGWGPLRAQS